jgi:hypothetical protein
LAAVHISSGLVLVIGDRQGEDRNSATAAYSEEDFTALVAAIHAQLNRGLTSKGREELVSTSYLLSLFFQAN